MKVVFWGTYDQGKPRNRILLQGLRELGVDVTACHADVWGGVEDKSQLRSWAGRLSRGVAWLLSYPRLIIRYLTLGQHDLVWVGYMGHLDVLVLAPFADWKGVPIVWDAFLSLYDTVVNDRKLVPPDHPLAALLRLWEAGACSAADLIVLDTQVHADYFAREYGLPAEKTACVLVGAECEEFASRDMFPDRSSERLQVLFYGQYIPLHGVDTIVRAAALAQSLPIDWVLVGQGQEEEKIRVLLAETPQASIQTVPYVPYSTLADWLRRADICLGIFGESDKAARVIPNKVFQALCAGKPVITRDSPAIRELLTPDMQGVELVPPADARALLDAVCRLQKELRQGFEEPLHREVARCITPRAIGKRFRQVIEDFQHRRLAQSTDGTLGSGAQPIMLIHPVYGAAVPEKGWVPAPRYLLRRRLVLKLLANQPRGNVLEVGCGAGALINDLAHLGFDCTALESSVEAATIARYLNRKQRSIRVFEEPDPCWTETFDYLLSLEVLEHIEDDLTALRRWANWLKPGGRLVLSVPAHMSKWNASDVWVGHFRRYEKDPLRNLITEAGFSVERVESYGFPVGNIIEPVRAVKAARMLRNQPDPQSPEQRAANTAHSGTHRTWETRIYPLQSSWLGVQLMRIAFWLQDLSTQTDWGNGYLVQARRR